MNLQIKRFSASVFAIRLSLEQNVIFQGLFRFLNDRVDNIIKHLRAFATSVKGAYSTTLDLIHDVERLADLGDRFTKQVGSFISRAFGNTAPEEQDIKFGIQNLSQSEVVLCGSLTGKNTATLGGRNGNIWLVDTSTGRVITSGQAGRSTIHSIAAVSDEYVAVGTDEGLALFAGIGRGAQHLRSSYNEKITAVVAPPWGGRGVAVVTGSSDGYLRRWSLAQGLTRYLGTDSREMDTKLGRSVQRIINSGEVLYLATHDEIRVFDVDLQSKAARLNVGFQINDICLFGTNTLLACGKGRIAHVNLESSSYSRVIGVSSAVDYTAVCRLNNRVFCVGSQDGKMRAISFESGEELGSIDLNMHIRGLICTGSRVLAFGGGWNSPRGRSVALVPWEAIAPARAG